MFKASPARWALVYLLATFVLNATLLTQTTSASGPHTLTVNTSGSGTVSRNPNFQQYPNGSVVTLTATPSSGSLFSHWTGDLTGSANPANIEMTAPKTVTASFLPIPEYSVTTSVSGQGTITLNPAGGTYASNTVVTATATPAQGWAFANWSGDAEGNSNPLSITVDRNKSITANFAELPAIVQPPANVATNSDSTVTFTVEARGADPLAYAWFFEGELIPGANSPTLTLTNVASTNEGTYEVRVSNAYGTASASATLLLTDSGCDGPNVVNTASESALRAAIETGGYVRLCFNGTITLTAPLNIAKDVTLDASARDITLSGNNATRIFNVSTNVTLAVTNLTLTAGKHRGEDHAEGGRPGFGGAIFNQGGTVILSNCRLTNNSAIGGNALASDPPAPGGSASGGAIFNERGILRITTSLISSNAAEAGEGYGQFTAGASGNAFGGAIAGVGGTVRIEHSEITTNICYSPAGGSPVARASGGAFNFNNTGATISNSTLRANHAVGGDGPSLTPPGRWPTPALGGAIFTIRGSLRITHSELLNNAAIGGLAFIGQGASGLGGAIYSDGGASIFFTTVASNIAQGGSGKHGGALAAGGAWLNSANGAASESVFFGNVARGGQAINSISATTSGRAFSGAIHNESLLALTNCTFTLNRALSGTTNLFTQAPFAAGGAIYSTTNNSVQALNVTFASNSAEILGGTTPGEARGANIVNDSGTVTLRNTILAYPNGTNSNVHGHITDGGHNISSDASANFNSGTSFNFTDPRLEPLADNGGPTLTMALPSDSPAIDFGANEGAPTIDQRGIARPFGDGIDIGAYERTQETTPEAAITMNAQGDLQLTFPAAAETSYQIQSSTNLVDWTTIETIPGSPNSTTIARQFESSGERTFYQLLISTEE